MKKSVIFAIALTLMTLSASAADVGLKDCEARYERAAGPFTRQKLNQDYTLFTTGEDTKVILSYKGKAARMFDGTSFNETAGALTTSVQDVMASDRLDQLNAALVYEFLTTADNDSDYPEVQLMTLQLQPKFPNVRVDEVLYWIVSANPNAGEKIALPFCSGRGLWTWKQVQTWLANYAIPLFLKREPRLIGDHALCADKTEGDKSVYICEQD